MRVKLDKVCKRIYAGGDVPKGRYSTVKTAEYAIPIYANAEKDNGLYGYTDTARENELSITVAARGTIGFTAIRREPFLPVVRLITVVPDLSTVSERYLYYALRNCKPAFSGTSIPQLTVPDIKKNEIELYSLSVQETIADKLDAVGRIIELRQQQLQKLDDLVKARFVELFGDPLTNPKGYQEKYLSEIAEYWNGLTYKPDDVANEGTIVLRSSNIQNASLDFADTVRVNCKIGTKKYVQDNDILMCSRNGSAKLVGKVALIKELSEPMSFGAFMMIIRSAYYPFLMTYFQLPAFRSQITTGATTTINQITGRMLDNVKLAIPDIESAKDFSAFTNQVDKSKVAVQKSLDEAQLLFDSLMQQYFG